MNRRSFVSSSVFALVRLGESLQAQRSAARMPETPSRKGGTMLLGCQSGSSDRHLRFFKRHGVDAICGNPPDPANGSIWSPDELSSFKERVEKHGLRLEMIEPPFLASSHVDRTRRPDIVLGRSPGRDRDIEDIQMLIRNCARTGIPAIKYNMSILGVLRTPSTPGRGGTRLGTWRLEEAGERARTLTRAGRVSRAIFWERISYFLERVIPVAEEYKIRMACHPHDPGVPPGFAGVDRVLGEVEGLKKFISIRESPYHGLNFCQGTVSEMLENPSTEIFDVIRYFGTRGKIFNVHFRNIRGHRNSFQETFPDEGDVNMVRALLTYREIRYSHMVMPDHVPAHDEDLDRFQAFAFCYGYIRGLLQALDGVRP